MTKDWWWIEVFRPAFVQAQAFIKRVVGKAENIAFSSILRSLDGVIGKIWKLVLLGVPAGDTSELFWVNFLGVFDLF